MHEMSVAMEICLIAEKEIGAEGLGRVREIGIDVGDEAGVDVSSLEFCLEALLSQPPFGQGRPAINRRTGDCLQVTYLEVDDGDSND